MSEELRECFAIMEAEQRDEYFDHLRRCATAFRRREQPCTCTGSCRGPAGLGEGWICSLKLPPKHNLFETGDPDAPEAIKDRNGEVVLNLCKRCGRGEAELSSPCAANSESKEGK